MLAFPKPPSKAGEKADAQRMKAAHRRIVYRLVSKRDNNTCRVPGCGKKGPGLHHHHRLFLSRGGKDDIRNIFLVCTEHHRDIHGYRLTVEGLDADHTLRFVRAR